MWLIRFVPKNLLSLLVGRLVLIKKPKFFVSMVKSWFVGRYKLNMDEAELPIEKYACLGDLFARKLQPNARPIQGGLIHPVDAQLTSVQAVHSETLIQAKGLNYSLKEFLKEPEAFEMFAEGMALTYYLCPTDYHRVHSPCDGEVISVQYVPGKLWPVNEWSVNSVKELFAVNERIVIWIKTNKGVIAYVMVGATNVGKMTLSFDREIISNQNILKSFPINKNYNPAVDIKAGTELGIFNMGSTVIMLTPKGYLDAAPQGVPCVVKMGQELK